MQFPPPDIGNEIDKLVVEFLGEGRLVFFCATCSGGERDVLQRHLALRCIARQAVDGCNDDRNVAAVNDKTCQCVN